MAQPDKDLLISRIVDDEATAEDWAVLKELAAAEPSIWQDLADAQYTSIGLASALEAAIECAESVDAPVHEHVRARLTIRAGTAAKWGGWLVAAAVTLAWMGPGTAGPGAGPGVTGASLGPQIGSASDAFQKYLDMGKQSGQVVQEVPQLMLMGTNRVPEGYEVIYLRQVIERAVVDDLYGLGQDEAGRPARIRLETSIVGPTSGPL